jgi:hypothetical protein
MAHCTLDNYQLMAIWFLPPSSIWRTGISNDLGANVSSLLHVVLLHAVVRTCLATFETSQGAVFLLNIQPLQSDASPSPLQPISGPLDQRLPGFSQLGSQYFSFAIDFFHIGWERVLINFHRLWWLLWDLKLEPSCNNQVIRNIETRFSVKSVCLLWYMCIVQRTKGIFVISVKYRSLSVD